MILSPANRTSVTGRLFGRSRKGWLVGRGAILPAIGSVLMASGEMTERPPGSVEAVANSAAPEPSNGAVALNAAAADLPRRALMTGDLGGAVAHTAAFVLEAFDRDRLTAMQLRTGEPLRTPWEDQSAVAVAVASRDVALLQQLLESGSDANEPLTSPVASTYIKLLGDDVVGFFLNKDSGLTPLMIAAGTNQPAAVRLLLKHGAKPLARTKKYRMYPLDYAAQRTRIEIMQLLLGRDPQEETEARKIVVSLSNQRASFWRDGQIVLSSPVSTGRRGYKTPSGEYVITQKYRNWRSTIYKVPMPNFMRLNSSSIGLHAGNVNSTRASHGCIRLPHGKSKEFFALARTGDRVTIVE